VYINIFNDNNIKIKSFKELLKFIFNILNFYFIVYKLLKKTINYYNKKISFMNIKMLLFKI
jgi:hypothetical protein